jgi:hypothetical protein
VLRQFTKAMKTPTAKRIGRNNAEKNRKHQA